jgi:hypothetical protein
MSNKIESKNSAWLMELSEQEQQAVAGGFARGMFSDFFFQQTDIRSFAENRINFLGEDANSSGSSSSKTGYMFSQTTLAFSLFPSTSRSSRYSAPGLMGSIFNLLRGGFDS